MVSGPTVERGLWSRILDRGTVSHQTAPPSVDGSTWIDDPRAVPVVEDEFGWPSSMLTVGEL